MEIIIQLGVVIVVATFLAVLGKFLKQPPLIAYIVTGLILGYMGVNIADSRETLDILSEVGIILLLFIAGLDIKFDNFMKVGKKTLIISEGTDLIMLVLGFVISYILLGLAILPSIFLSLALALSSTIVVIKTLESRKEIESPHGNILIGNMVLQDLLAMTALAIFVSLAKGGSPLVEIGITLLKGILLFFVLYFIARYIIARIFYKIADQIEIVFLGGLTWVFLGVLISDYIGFSKEIGAFIAGISIASLPFAFEIKDKAMGVQEFGLLLFFFTIGASTTISKDILFSWTFILLVLFVIFITPLVRGGISSFLALEKKRNFLISMIPIQVSEFSLVIAAVGLKLGQIDNKVFSLITLITIATIILSSGILANLNKIYRRIEDYLDILEWRVRIHTDVNKGLKGHAILLGAGFLGEHIIRYLKRKGMEVVVVDWLPERVDRAEKLGCKVYYGDAGDPDVWKEISADKAKIIISTIEANQEDDISMYRWVKRRNRRCIMVAETNVPKDAKELKDLGYDLVILQDEAEWEYSRKMISKFLKKIKK